MAEHFGDSLTPCKEWDDKKSIPLPYLSEKCEATASGKLAEKDEAKEGKQCDSVLKYKFEAHTIPQIKQTRYWSADMLIGKCTKTLRVRVVGSSWSQVVKPL